MSIQYWSDMSILVGGLELAGFGKDVNLSTTVAELDTTDFASQGYRELIGGRKSATISLGLMQDMAVGSVDDTAWSLLGVADIPHSICTPSADGSLAYLWRGIPLSYSPTMSPVGDLAMTQINGQSSTGGVVRGTLIHPGSASRSSSSTGTGQQLGAVVAGKSMYAALHVLSAAGSTPSLTVKVQSDDNSNFTSATDRITFTAATTGNTYQWLSVAGAITDDWWRISYTISGSGPSFSFAVTAGIL